MSEESARSFIDKLKSDPNLREELSAHLGQGALDHALSFAAKKGHEFSHEDLVSAYASDLTERGYSQADVEDLKSAAGNPGQYGPMHGTYAAKSIAPY